jgi:hypothetical protein
MELYDVPLFAREQCVHRAVPLMLCIKMEMQDFGPIFCHEQANAYFQCRSHEHYRNVLLKQKFREYSKDYTEEEKRFFPSGKYMGAPFFSLAPYWSMVAGQRLSGWDEKDPQNPLYWKEPNRALMRAEFSPTNWERGMMTSAFGQKIITDEIVAQDVPCFPLPEDKRPV